MYFDDKSTAQTHKDTPLTYLLFKEVMTPLILSLLFAFIFFFIQHSCIFSPICSSYAGHGSGLQYISGRNIAKFQMHCVVFLFGCDSSRLHSNGLYSELLGPHLYYHAAMWWVKRKHWCWTDTHIHANVYGVTHSRDVGGIFFGTKH